MPVVSIFNGRCIHGQQGAKMEKGVLINRGCEHCLKMIGECCTVPQPDKGEPFVGSQNT